MSITWGSDSDDFAFSYQYGNDLLNHVARALLDRGGYSEGQVQAAVEDFYVESCGSDPGILWELTSAKAVDVLHDIVDAYLDKEETLLITTLAAL